MKSAWRPFSAACSSSFFFSSGLKFPAFSAAWIWSKTAFNSIADLSVDTLVPTVKQRYDQRPGHSRFAEDVVFPLYIMQPAADTKEGLVCSSMVFRLCCINEPDGMEKLDAIRFALELPVVRAPHVRWHNVIRKAKMQLTQPQVDISSASLK